MPFLFALLVSLSSYAGWEVSPPPAKYLELNPILFSNRAECALESKRPTKSVFLVADTLDIGKALFRLGEARRLPESFSSEGVRRYRYTLFTLSRLVLKRLLDGQLPLLDARNRDYQDLLAHCRGGCQEIDDYLARVWHSAADGGRSGEATQTNHVSCYALDSFSSLFPHLAVKKPDRDVLKDIAEAVHNHPENAKSCTDALTGDLSVGMYQLDLMNLNDEDWSRRGFSVWQSFNVYLSWAFRNSPESAQLALNYFPVFRQVNLEELTVFFSNGCRSMTNPECGKDYINTNSIRDLARIDSTQDLSKLELFSFFPENDPRDRITDGDFDVNDDRLGFGRHESATAWAKNFKDNLAKSRGFVRVKLSQALAGLKLIRNGVGDRLTAEFAGHGRGTLSEDQRKELYLACSEMKVAMARDISFLRAGLEKLLQNDTLWNYTRSIHESTGPDLDWFVNEVAPKVLEECNQLSKLKLWENDERPANAFFSPWYQQYVFKKVQKPDAPLTIAGAPFLSFHNGQTRKQETVCQTPATCVRSLLVALIDLKISSDFASGLLALSEDIKTPNLTNPLAEKVACRAYDPWAQSKKAAYDFFQDMLLAGLSTAVVTPIYLDVSVLQKKVASLDELVKDGKVYYNPKFERGHIQRSLILDFGPLTGTPCAIGVSGDTRIRPPSYLAFEGVTLQSCRDRSRNTLSADSPEDIRTSSRNLSGCFTCTISLTTVASSAAAYNPITRPFFYVIRGVFRLVNNLRSFDDIPRSWEVDYNSVYRSWRRHDGRILSSCARKLMKGEECLVNSCEENIVANFEKFYGLYVTNLRVISGGVSEISTLAGTYQLRTPRLSCAGLKLKKSDFALVSAPAAPAPMGYSALGFE